MNHSFMFGISPDSLIASVKEACLLAMLRVAADCEEIPEDVKGKVQKASEVSGRYLRRVCL